MRCEGIGFIIQSFTIYDHDCKLLSAKCLLSASIFNLGFISPIYFVYKINLQWTYLKNVKANSLNDKKNLSNLLGASPDCISLPGELA